MRVIWAKIRFLFRPGSHARDLGDELDTHLQMEVDALIARGLPPDQARATARRQFSSPARLREAAHEAWLFPWLESASQDFRYGLRQIRRSPGLSLAVVTSLAIGLGANTAIFSLIDAAVLRPLPVADPSGLVQLEWRYDKVPARAALFCSGGRTRADQAQASGNEGGQRQMPCVSEPIFRGLAQRQTGFLAFLGVSPPVSQALSTTAEEPASQVLSLYVSWSFFDGLGVPVVLGRSFIEEDDGPSAEPTAVVSHRFWSSRLGRDPNVIGHSLRINDLPVRIVGIAAPGFFGLTPGTWIDVYRPLATLSGAPTRQNTGFLATYWNIEVLARPGMGQSGSAAAAALTAAFRGLVAETMGAEIENGLELVARPAARGLDVGRNGAVAQALRILMLLVGVLLLIVCANVANLLLSRAVKRRPESAIRLALGGGRGRLVRQHLVESGMLAVFGGAAGLGLGVVLARWIHTAYQTGQGPGAAFAVTLDWRVSGYAVAISMLTAVIFGLAPAWTAARSDVSNALKGQSRSVTSGGIRLSKVLVSVQFALSFAALVAAGLLGRSLKNLYSTDLGFAAEQLSFATVWPAGYGPRDVLRYRERLKQEVEAIPGVVAVAPLMWRPLQAEASASRSIEVPGGPPAELLPGITNPAATAYTSSGGPGFVGVLGLQLLAGRSLGPGDACEFFRERIGGAPIDAGGPPCPVHVDQRFADVFFQGKNPVGQVFRSSGRSHQVVGLVGNARLFGLRHEARPTIYGQLTLEGIGAAPHLAIRARIESDALAAAVRQAVARVDPAVPLSEFHTQSGLVDRLLRTERLLALVSGAFSVAALSLAAVGLVGLLGYAVARRTNEIGIRMALGASGSQVRRMVVVESVSMVGAGILVGVPAAWAVGRYLRSQLVGLEPTDPSTTVLALLALVIIASVAALLPARRAARVNPMTALREE